MRQEYTGGNLRAGTVKIMQDGVMENYTAAMSEPYYVEGNPTGIPMVEPEFLKEAVTALDAAGFQVHFHAIGDAAITQCLDAVEAAIAGERQRASPTSHLAPAGDQPEGPAAISRAWRYRELPATCGPSRTATSTI